MKTAMRFEIRAQASTPELLIYDVIGPAEQQFGAKRAVQELAALKHVGHIDVRINSGGGIAHEGIAIYNALERHPARITVHIDGLAASVASLIAMAGDTIIMADNGLMMIHDPMAMVVGGNAEDLRAVADTIERVRATMMDTYAARTGQSREQIGAWMAAETWFDAEEAVEAGFADRIGAARRIAAQIDWSRFRNAPHKVAGNAAPSPAAQFRQRVAARVAGGMDRNGAVAAVAKADPHLHAQVIAQGTRQPFESADAACAFDNLLKQKIEAGATRRDACYELRSQYPAGFEAWTLANQREPRRRRRA